MELVKILGLFIATALAEIIGCYLPYLWLKQDRSAWLLVPASLSLAAFVWLLSLHPHAAGRVYAAYGGIYIGVAIMWLWASGFPLPSASSIDASPPSPPKACGALPPPSSSPSKPPRSLPPSPAVPAVPRFFAR